MTGHDRATYRASDEFAAAYRAYRVRLRIANDAVNEWNDAHPDAPLRVSMYNIDRSIRVDGFNDVHPAKDVPNGLSRARGRDYLIPKRGKPGDPWRAIEEEFDRYPSASADVYDPHGVPTYRLIDFKIHTTGIHDFGDAGVFVRIGVPFEEPSAHLTPVPQSEFYRAQESAETIATAETR